MFEIVMALVVLGLVVTVLSALVFWKRKKSGVKQEINYYAFFVMGICFLPLGAVGIATENYGFMGLTGIGIIYMGVGLANRDKWPQNKKSVTPDKSPAIHKTETRRKKTVKRKTSMKK